MKTRKSRIWKILGLFLCVFALSGCTKPLTTMQDKTSVMMSKEDYQTGETFGNYGKDSQSYKIDEFAKQEGYLLPSAEFNTFMEGKITTYVETLKTIDIYADKDDSYLRGIATFGGAKEDKDGTLNYTKNGLWINYNKWLNEARKTLGIDKCPDNSYVTYYQGIFNNIASGYTTTITPVDGYFGGVYLEGKTWGEAFDYGLIEGLLVYPISWLIFQLSNAFGLNGWGQIGAILIVTLIIRGILLLLTFKQTLAQQKMTALQPQLAKIQAKYPNSQTNQYEKQRMAQEQMALYKKNKINPLGSLIVIFFQFPVFIAVWGAMQGSAVLMTGDLLGLSLSAMTSSAMFDFSTPAAAVAWVIFILMAAGQIVSMKLPQWMQKKKQQEIQKLGKNPSMDQSQKTMSMVNNIMMIFIIFMGLSLPIAMSIYWFVSSLISVLQTLVTQHFLGKVSNDKKHVKYKTKK